MDDLRAVLEAEARRATSDLRRRATRGDLALVFDEPPTRSASADRGVGRQRPRVPGRPTTVSGLAPRCSGAAPDRRLEPPLAGTRLLGGVALPDARASLDDAERRDGARELCAERQPGAAAASSESTIDADVRAVLPTFGVPTLDSAPGRRSPRSRPRVAGCTRSGAVSQSARGPIGSRSSATRARFATRSRQIRRRRTG